jgi:hypothetical protein
MLSYWYYRRVDMAAVVAESGLPTRMMVDSGRSPPMNCAAAARGSNCGLRGVADRLVAAHHDRYQPRRDL